MVALAKQPYTAPMLTPRPLLGSVLHGDCLSILKALPDNSVDAIVTDPPSSIGFMGQTWDKDKGGRDNWIAWLADIMQEALRVLKPGGHALVWALPRTSHYTAMALEDAGFTIRDSIVHLQSQGFPKSHSISKAIDAHFKADREVVGVIKKTPYSTPDTHNGWKCPSHNADASPVERNKMNITAPATPEAQQYSGYGSALKPSHETWWLARKPLAEPTIAANVLRWGTGGLNIDASRINPGDSVPGGGKSWGASSGAHDGWKRPSHEHYTENTPSHTQGRFPSNTLFSHTLLCEHVGTKRVPSQSGSGHKAGEKRERASTYNIPMRTSDIPYHDPDGMEEIEAWHCVPECPVFILDQQSGIRKTGDVGAYIRKGGNRIYGLGLAGEGQINTALHKGDEGGASRYFQTFAPDTEDIVPFVYQSKPSRKERNAGCEALPEHMTLRYGEKGQGPLPQQTPHIAKPETNSHPTVKSTALMKYLCQLVCPSNGIVLDPFAGSGSTLVACVQSGFQFIGIEQEEAYVRIAEARIQHALTQQKAVQS